MPHCHNCNLEQAGQFCARCGAELQAQPPAGPRVAQTRGDTGVDRSVSQTVVLSPSGTPAPESLPWDFCPIDGLYVRRDRTFRCRRCGREHLCREHLDPELQVCSECAAELQGSAQAEMEARLAPLRAEAEAGLAEKDLARALLACGKALALDPEDAEAGRLVQAGQAALRELRARLEETQETLKEARERAEGLASELSASRVDRDSAEADRASLQEELARVKQELARWRQAAEEAQARLDEIAERQRAEEEARRRAEEEARRAPVWKQIGIEMVAIPAGEYRYGDNKEKAHLSACQLARTPVTNAQYKAFVDATGHEAPRHWQKDQIPPGKENHPVVYVSWEDARAFCQWAGCRLPTEQEWEKAARGADGRAYPWGDSWEAGRCNSHRAGIGDTTAVDRYPNGASPYGLLDMAGNVWEWCEDWYDSERRDKVLRGSSWFINIGRDRSAIRFRSDPDSRSGDLGFRCGMSSMSSP